MAFDSLYSVECFSFSFFNGGSPNMNLVLVNPSEKYVPSFLDSMQEHESEGFSSYKGMSFDEIRANPQKLLNRIREGSIRYSSERVPEIVFWAVEDDQYIGRISIRKSLTRSLWEHGGHIGYEVRPSARRRGYATAMLKSALPKALDMGLLRVMVTCKDTNVASQKVIENSGGHKITDFSMESEKSRFLRYWISTCPVGDTLQRAINESVAYLESPAALNDVSRDPYWPKWNSPWWHMHCLREIGRAHLIPKPVILRLFDTIANCYLPGFPFSEADLPADADPYRSTQCHCQKGCLVGLAIECQERVDEVMSDAIDWFSRYQMADGGFNCDNEAYLRERPVSSFVSSAPVFESLLECEILGAEIPDGLVDSAAHFFVERKLHCSIRTGKVVNPAWRDEIFPRFYEYDLLRGIEALTEWMHRRGKTINDPWFSEICALVLNRQGTPADSKSVRNHKDSFSIQPQEDGRWSNGRSTSFSLLDLLSQRELADPFLQVHRNRVQFNLRSLGLLSQAW